VNQEYKTSNKPVTVSTHKIGSIQTTYKKLQEMFGNPQTVVDRRVTCCWVFSKDNQIFMIHDWKQEFKDSTTTTTFSISGNVNSPPFIKWLNETNVGIAK